MKKLASLLLALVMILSCTFAMAEDTSYNGATNSPAIGTYTIRVGENDSRSYSIYQIFTGNLAVIDGKEVLSNIEWGVNGKGAATGTPVTEAILNELVAVNDKTDKEQLAVIEKYVDMASPYKTVTADAAVEVPTGYYLIKDEGVVKPGEAYSLFVVQVVGDTTIAPKRGTVESYKKVMDTNDTAGQTTGWQDSADHDINDDVPFQLYGKVADDYANYDSYKFIFHDTLSEGLTFNNDVKAYYMNGETKVDIAASQYTVVTTGLNDGCTFEVNFSNLKDINGVTANTEIYVEYTAKLNEKAILGSTGNPNTMKLEYSNNPNSDGDGKTGTTPEDKVIVFTYKVVVNKTHKVGDKFEALKGAGFTLQKKNSSNVYENVGAELKGDEMTTFEWKGLDDGEYKLIETTTPAGYNTIADIEFTITAEHEVLSNDPRLTALDGGNLFTGKFVLPDPTDTEKPTTTEGILTTDVENKSGSTLPETGGMGTTLLYVGGGILVLAAIVMLIAKRRVNAD